jgi:multiple sugar transport system substrate-binding protein
MQMAGVTRAQALRLAAVGSLAGLQAACRRAEPAPGQAPAPPVTVSWMSDWTGGARGEATKASIALFEAQHPRIKLEHLALASDLYQTLTAHLAAGTLADVVLFSPNWFIEWAERNTMMDIAAHLRKFRFDKESVFWPGYAVEHKGKVHGLPYQFGVGTWLYNKTWFEREGIAPPTDAWTLEDVLAAGRKLARPAERQWAVDVRPEINLLGPWIYANGADVVTSSTPIRTAFDQPKQLEVLQYLVDLIHRHQVAPILWGPNAVTGVSFTSGSLAMSVSTGAKGVGASVRDQFQWDVMPTPRWPATRRRVTHANHQPHVVTKAAEQRGHGDAAVQLIMWLAGEQGQTLVAKTGGAVPVHKKAATSPVYLDGNPPSLKTQLDMLTTKPDQEARAWKIWAGWSHWYDAVLPILRQGFGGELSVRDMATKATQAGNAAIDSFRL